MSPQHGADQPKVQAGRYLWIALPLIFGVVVTQALIPQGLPVLYPFIQAEFGLTRAQVGIITSSYAAAFGVAVLPAGMLADYFGVKRLVTISLLSVAALTLLFPLAYSFPIVLALSAVIAIAASPLHPASTLAVIGWFPVRVRALVMGLKQTGFPIVGVFTAALLPALSLVVGWRIAAAVTGLVVMVIAVLFIWKYRDVPRSGEVVHKFNFAALRTIVRDRALLTSIVWGSAFSGFHYIVVTYFMLFLMEELGFSAIAAGGMLAMAHVGSSFSRSLWGAASDFVFRGRRKPVLVIIGFVTVAWMVCISFTNILFNPVILYLIAIVIGSSTMSYQGVLTTLIGEQAEPGQVGGTVGFASMGNHACQMLMPPLFGFLVDLTSSYPLGWRVAAAVALAVTLALMAFSKEPQGR